MDKSKLLTMDFIFYGVFILHAVYVFIFSIGVCEIPKISGGSLNSRVGVGNLMKKISSFSFSLALFRKGEGEKEKKRLL